ncbi:hypothetical protein Ade02nite_18120 [Paractinoplanes deccanensis]|uniref:Uncharacterized protein n=1 Tax=Paractinoplanes deccanensis TaxID=113561 RepID=A0ABQ3XZK0_9ACTN|nr:hypothetical protein [Actinoplanes deccanensis]GID73171.1 hypothetical protein Ade02nite_18120 [Actinoplanes deccanensis]
MTSAPLAHTDVVVLDYLAALWAQSDDLSPELRDDLMSTVADYIAMRRTSPSSPLDDPAEIISRLGPPEALVAAARRGSLPPHIRMPALVPPPSPAATGGGAVARGATAGGAAEHTAIGLMTAGALVLPGVAPVAGMLLASGSPHWTPAQKATAWFLTLGSGAAAFAFLMLLAAAGSGAAAAVLFCYMIAAGGSLAAGWRLYDGLRRA